MRSALALSMILGCSGPAATTTTAATPVETTTPATRTEEARTDEPPAVAPVPPKPPSNTGAPPATPIATADLESVKAKPQRNHESQAEIAARVNQEGKAAAFAGKYAVATSKFREAVARVPEPAYFYNLCTTLFQEGKFGEALTACNAIEKNMPPAALAAKTKKMIERILDEAKRQSVEVVPGE